VRGSQSKRPAGAAGTAKPRGAEDTSTPGPEELRTRSRDELRAIAKRLGLTGVSSLKKDALLARVAEASRAAAEPKAPPVAAPKPPPVAAPKPPPAAKAPAARAAQRPAPAPAARPPPAPKPKPPLVEERRLPVDAPPPSEDEPSGLAKLDLGPGAAKAEKAESRTIPWSYGQDRVTAAAVDPARLFVYWEVTDPAIDRARAALGEGGADAWLNLRVYDTTGRIFDGTNAHSYFDHGLGRDDRQWFFHIGKPSSSAYVELGLRSRAGHFVKISRSSRVDFPRNAPVQEDAPEWLTVRVGTGEAFSAGRGGGQGPARTPAPAPVRHHPPGAIPVFELGSEPGHDGLERRIWQLLHGDGHRVEWQQLLGGAGWFQLEGRVEWEGPALVTRWEAGPFSYPVSVEPPSREAWEGQSFAFRVGEVTHVVYGPWQVVIRNLGAFSERAEVARWEVFRSWVSSAGRELRAAALGQAAGRPGGASEALGASERRWLAGSELRFGGASEVFRLGASEIRLRGASETLFAGASQWVARGASERRLGGASEVRMRGASERRLGGASESRVGGGSESRLGGASEGRLGAGSEGRLGASEHRLAPEAAAGGAGAAPAASPYPKVEE
jgi:hypothetical protein